MRLLPASSQFPVGSRHSFEAAYGQHAERKHAGSSGTR